LKKASLLLEKNIFGLVEIQKILEYVKNRECVNGGYCFYRQQEPNTSDTFYAITIRNLLENNFSASNSTVAYLKELQYLDGSYFSIIQAYYAINALVALPSSPTVDPTGYIINNFRSFDLQNLPAEISVYRKIYFLVSLVNVLKIPLSSELNDDIVDYVFMFKNQDYGFGSLNKSTLMETMQALQILDWVNYPIHNIKDLDIFVSKCISPNRLFTNIPQIAPSFIEHVNAGYVISRIMSIKQQFLNTSIEFIKGCQTSLGGFSRVPFTGIATLEYTYYALNALHLLAEYL
jgi:hypothetical protein